MGVSFKSLKNLDLPRILYEIEDAGINFIHLDFFDGKMVSSLALSYNDALLLRKQTRLPLEAHLMEYEPKEMAFYRDLGINRVLIHHESLGNKEKLLLEAKEEGMEAGIALKPSTPHTIKEILHTSISDLILVMATKSGSGGITYDENAPGRVRQIASLYAGPIEVNSGVITYPDRQIEEGTTYKLSKAGATRFALEGGILNTNLPILDAVKLNLLAVNLPSK